MPFTIREPPAMIDDHAANEQSMSENIPDMESFVSSEQNEEEINAQLERLENLENKDDICPESDFQSADNSEEQ